MIGIGMPSNQRRAPLPIVSVLLFHSHGATRGPFGGSRCITQTSKFLVRDVIIPLRAFLIPLGRDGADRHGRARSVWPDRSGHGRLPPLTNREVADCAVDRAEKEQRRKRE
jgi:hypothetical protein